MIQLTNTAAQTLAPGQALTFDSVQLKTGCAEHHRVNSSIATLRAKCATYEVSFGASVGGTAAGPVQLGIELDGEPIFTGTVTDYVTVAADPVSVARTIPVRTDSFCCGRLTVVNTGTSDVIVSPGASLYVRRVA